MSETLRPFACSLLLFSGVLLCLPSGGNTAENSPEAVVRDLYRQIVKRRPIGIPNGVDKAAIWPFLSKKLVQKLESSQSCEEDYYRKHKNAGDKPEFDWLEMGLFSGGNEEANPAAAAVSQTLKEKDGSFHVYVRLTYKESFETYGRPPNSANTFHWNVAAIVISEDGSFVVDDVLLFKGNSAKIDSRLMSSFSGCDGSRWVGEKSTSK